MNNTRSLLPVGLQLLTPKRTFISRRFPWDLVNLNLSRQLDDVDRTFARIERDMNSAFRDMGFGRFGIPATFREPSFFGNRHSPVIQEVVNQDGNGKYLVKMELGKEFNPENVKVSLKDRVVTIEAKFENKSEDGSSRLYQEISKSFTLPENVKIEAVKSLFTPDGELLIEVPLPEIVSPQPKEIPISIESK